MEPLAPEIAREESAVHSTADLLERARAGERGAFDRLFALALARVEWFVGLRLGRALRQKIEVADLVQETYAAAWERLGAFEAREEGAFVRWLFALAGNAVRRAAEQQGAQKRSAVRLAGPADAALVLAADPRSGPCTRAARLESRARVALALQQLDDELREALVLRVLEGRELALVAAHMGKSESAVRRLVARGLAELGRSLKSEGDHD